jgi:uncharacterized protein YbjT (DUF2867 family)
MLQAILLGASGLVGSSLLTLLLEDARVTSVVSLARRPSGKSHAKLQERVVDFREFEVLRREARGDILLSALGTTLRKAGSKEAQYEVDYTFQWNVARAAAENGVRRYVLCSAAGASATSPLFYNRMKGELDRDVAGLGFASCHVVRPSILDGERGERRTGEALGLAAMRLFAFVPGLRTYRPIPGETVARAMWAAALREDSGSFVHGPTELFEMARAVG